MENWRNVVGYEGLYEVSDLGRVRNARTGVIKEPTFRKDAGYSRPFLNIWKEGKQKIMRPHTLVLTAFVGPRPKGKEGCHNDGNTNNNALSNLRWDTRKANQADRVRHGTTNRGERCGTHKLTLEQVRAIRLDTRPQKTIAEEYGVRAPAISRIKTGARWGHS